MISRPLRSPFRYSAFLVFCVYAFGLSPVMASPITFDPGEWQLGGDAAAIDGGAKLTPFLSGKTGRISYIPGMCAKEFKITYEMNLGTNIGSTGGSGLAFMMLNDQGVVEYKVFADTWLNAGEDTRFEINDNHVSVESLGAYTDMYGNPPTAGTTTFGPFAAAFVPFRLEGTGWVRTTLHKKAGAIDVTVTDGTHGLNLTSNIYYAEGGMLYPAFEAATATAKNEQSIRNIQIDILDRSDCADFEPPLQHDEVVPVITAACGDNSQCPPRAEYMPCVEGQVGQLLESERLTSDVANILLLEAQFSMTYCDGIHKCQEEIDPETIRKAAYETGFSAGVASVDVTGIEATAREEGRSLGYTEGFAAGAASIDTDAIRQSGYSEGFLAGVASIDIAAIRVQGYTAGYEAGSADGYQKGLADGKASGYEEGLAAGKLEGYQEGYDSGKTAGYDEGFDAGFEEGYQISDAWKHNHIDLHALCSPSPDKVRRWLIKNPLPVPVVVSWGLHKSNQKGTVLIKARSEATLETQTIHGPNVLRIFAPGRTMGMRAGGARRCSTR